MCKNRIKYRTDVATSAENMKDVGCLVQKICGIEIVVALLKIAQAQICYKMSHMYLLGNYANSGKHLVQIFNLK